MVRFPLALLLLATASAAAAGPRVRITTDLGPITIEVDTRHAPLTSANFLRYVDAKKLDGTTFYRAARNRHTPTNGLIQGGIDHNARLAFEAIRHEPTSKTGLRHVDGTVSMARNAPGTAMGDFFITIGPASYLDATPQKPGYAAFGKVVGGMAVVKRILALPTYPGGWSAETKGQSIIKEPRILSARRLP